MGARLGRIALIGALVSLAGLFAAASWPRGELHDFGAFVAAGRAVRDGLDPYGVYALTPRGGDVAFPNLNPPVLLLPFRMLAPGDPRELFAIWYGVNLALYGLALALLARAHPWHRRTTSLAWAVAFAPLWVTVGLGQVYVALTLLAAGTYVLLARGRGAAAGALLGLLVAAKPNFILWPVLLFAAGERRAALVAASVGGVLSAVPLLLWGPGIYRDWIATSAALSARTGLTGLVEILAASAGAPAVGWLLTGAGVLALLAAVRRRRGARPASGLGLVGSLLLLPATNPGYFLVLAPVFLSDRWTRARVAAAALLMAPGLMAILVAPALVYAGALALLAASLCLGPRPGDRAASEAAAA
jgi:hypothetical protein